MKKIKFGLVLFCSILLFGASAFAHPGRVYPDVCNKPYPINQPPVWSEPSSIYYIPDLPSLNSQYFCQSINVPQPQIIEDNGGLLPVGNFIERNGKNYFMFLNGVFARNVWLKAKGKWYYFDISSEMVKGWCRINGLIYYFNADGCMATGTTIIDGAVHYFDAMGAMVY